MLSYCRCIFLLINFKSIIKCLNQIISENKPYDWCLCTVVKRRAGDLEVRVRVPVQVQIFLLKFNNIHFKSPPSTSTDAGYALYVVLYLRVKHID